MAELYFCDHCLCNKARQYAVKSWGSTIYAVFGRYANKPLLLTVEGNTTTTDMVQYAVKSWGSTIYAVLGHIVIKQDGMQISLVVLIAMKTVEGNTTTSDMVRD